MDPLGVVLGDDRWLPNTRSYNCLLQACSVPQLRNSMEEVGTILERISDRIQTIDYHHKLDSDALTALENNYVLPNIYTFNAILQAYAAASTKDDSPDNNNVEKARQLGETADLSKHDTNPQTCAFLLTLTSSIRPCIASVSFQSTLIHIQGLEQ